MRPRTLAEQIADLEDPTPKDFDPEADHHNLNGGQDSGSDAEEVASADGRTHYVEVGKSKLRKRGPDALGPQYKGMRISRNELLNPRQEHDPFAGMSDEESEEEYDVKSQVVETGQSNGQDEEEQLGFEDGGSVGSVSESDGFEDEDGMSSLDDDSESALEESDNDDNDNEEGGEDMDNTSGGKETIDRSKLRRMLEEDEDNVAPGGNNHDYIDGPSLQEEARNRTELKRLMAGEQKTVAATISQAAREDAQKGQAVKQQRTTFDSLLNTRIRLQKAMVATNTLTTTGVTNRTGGEEPLVEAAEEAALRLWESLNSLRASLESARTGQKRKRTSSISVSTPSSALWSHLQAQDATFSPHRNAVLTKWSAKAKGISAATSTLTRRLNPSREQTIVDVLTAQLSTPDRLIARTRMPRSCAPVQLAQGVSESTAIYDDADFYGLLLKELLEQRSATLTSNAASAPATAAISINGLSAGWQAVREAKTKKKVDTKASKGRKLRYTVHEKLQNFMAPEDRGTWGSRQVDELFGGLLGRRVGLEEVESEASDDEMGGAVEEGVRLFG